MRKGLFLGDGEAGRLQEYTIKGLPKLEVKDSIDINPDKRPTYLWDLNELPWPVGPNAYEEVHAYEVLEHLGTQGDAKAFFDQMYEIWTTLKNGGLFYASFPKLDSPWLLAEPSHTRVLAPWTFNWLDPNFFDKQNNQTSATDFGYLWKGHFDWVFQGRATPCTAKEPSNIIIMKAVKEGPDVLGNLLDKEVEK